MSNSKIHCPVCSGYGKNNIGIACLNCEGSGIVENTEEQQIIISENENKLKKIKEDFQRYNDEKLRQEAIDNEFPIVGCIGGIILIGFVSYLIIENWEDVLMFLLEVLLLLMCIGVIIGMFSSRN